MTGMALQTVYITRNGKREPKRVSETILKKLGIAEGSELSGFQIKRIVEEVSQLAKTTSLEITPKT